MVTFTDRDDRRSAHLRNRAIQNANAVRERRATVENPQWAMSRDADWYQDRGNLASIKDTLVNQQGNRDFWTTDRDESRNMYQILMNQMKGGDRGARMMDLRGLPSVVQSDPNRYRRGRTMFQDPSKSQGFLGDVGSLFSGNNRAAVYADEYNPFPKAGFGKDWYRDQFPIASGLGSFMEAAENFIPGATWAKQFLPKSKRLPLERDLSWVPEGVGEYDKIPEIPFLEDLTETIEEETIDDRIPRGPFPPGIAYPGYNADITITDLPPETFEKPTDEIFNEEVFNKVYKFPDPTGFTNFPYAFDAPWNLFEAAKENMEEGEWTDQELLDRLIKRGYLIDKTGGEDLEDINLQFDDALEDQADVLNEIEEIKRKRKINDEKAADLGLWYNI
jgi:hypothetical protein